MKNSEKVKKSSEELSDDLRKNGQKRDQFAVNLVHLLFIHGLLISFYNQQDLDHQLKSFVHDLLLIHEHYIDKVDDEKLKEKMNYSPLPEEEPEEEKEIV
jgi:hypothetical protein